MSASSSQAVATAGPGARGGWLYGPAVDWWVGAGGLYLVSIPLLWMLTRTSGMGAWPVAVAAAFALFVSGPHYGATLLRVYEQREDRRRYALFAVWVTLALCGLFVVGLHDAWVGSLLVTAYATWSPWHFSGQNYGLSLMFLRRRGVPVEPRVKRLLYASFVLSYALAFGVLHGGSYSVAVASVPLSDGSVFRFLSLGIPASVLAVAFPVTAAFYALSLLAAVALLLRRAGLRDLSPALSLVLVQALWFALPGALRVLGGVSPSGLAFAVVWVSACHSAQYLWVTSYYARAQDPSRRVGPYLAGALWAGSIVTILPALVFAPGVLGRVPFELGLGVLLFSVVNLHHFVLDGAIWKLRDGRVARLLLRDGPGPEPVGVRPRRPWLRPVVAGLGALCLLVAATDVWEREFVVNHAGADMVRVLRAADVLAWIGRDSPSLHAQVGNVLARRDRNEEAVAEFRRSLALYPTAAAWLGLGRVYAREARWEQATHAFRSAAALEPDDPAPLVLLARAWAQRDRPDLEEQTLERALKRSPGNAQIRRELGRARSARR